MEMKQRRIVHCNANRCWKWRKRRSRRVVSHHLQQKSTGEEDKRGERQREEEEGVVRLHVSNELCSHAH